MLNCLVKIGNEANLTKRLFAKQSTVFFHITYNGIDQEVSFAFFHDLAELRGRFWDHVVSFLLNLSEYT